METKKSVEIIVKIRNNKKIKKTKPFIKKYVLKNIEEFRKELHQIILIFKEISNKINKDIPYLIRSFFELIKFKIYTEKDEKIIDCLSVLFNKENWEYISLNFYDKLSLKFIDKHADKLDWFYIYTHKKLPEYFIDKHSDKVDWDVVSECQILSEPFIEKHLDKICWWKISGYQILSEQFIEKHADKINWFFFSMYQKLSENFIEKHAHKVNWEYIFKYQNISEEFKMKHAWRTKFSHVM